MLSIYLKVSIADFYTYTTWIKAFLHHGNPRTITVKVDLLIKEYVHKLYEILYLLIGK